MDQGAQDDKEINSILEMNLDGLDTLGLEDASFPAAPSPLGSLEKSMAANARMARLQSQWDKGEPGDQPSGLPLNRGIEQIAPIERTLTYKATVVKSWDTAVAQAKETYDLICLGEINSMASVRALVRLKTAMRCPCSAMLSARLEPIVPRPIRPISAFSIVSSLLSDLVGWSPRCAGIPFFTG